MKRWIFLVLAAATLAGAGFVLLRTDQAPLVTVAETVAESTETVPTPVPVSDAAPPPPPPVKHISTEEFRALGAEVMKALPTKADRKKDELQDGPAPIVTAGVELGKIAQAAADDPGLETEAVALYRECAGSPQYPDSVRALCFANYKKTAQKIGAEIDETIVKKYLRDLAERLGQ